MLVKSVLLFGLLLTISKPLSAQETATPQGLEYCTVCHGSQLKGNSNIGAPRLTQLSPWYVNRQLKNFRDGIRGNHPEDKTGGEMMVMVSQLSEQEIENIVEWIASTESSKPTPSITANPHDGEKLFQTCAACHGADAHGNKALGAPNLNGLNDWYILTQLNHFRSGIRGSEEDDTYGQQMKAASAVITSDQDAADLAAYITQLK
ncbi:cytochrome c [Psychrosphaera saromensis]|uniref:Cytochrome C n=1 Tax=Psychrosphaera saromensis TaxID=716813 RepID=A0A2S7US73_9GAMM|nr:c-type cytochrome [Psychrosphaera saromensis]PQJ52777.1 cytochrome C [Psychrosphaera saromensis]GHB71182.1 cytochrome c [Psychrosphaera saromensis]GLQ13273.1 cytochrome c [Psychrosphaera saromensis]